MSATAPAGDFVKAARPALDARDELMGADTANRFRRGEQWCKAVIDYVSSTDESYALLSREAEPKKRQEARERLALRCNHNPIKVLEA